MSIVISEDGLSAVMKSTKAMVTIKNDKSTRPTSPVVDDFTVKNGKVARWGDDNLFPQTVIRESSSNTIIPPTLGKKTELLYSGGIYTAMFQDVDDLGNEKVKPVYYQPFEDFKRQTNFTRYLIESITDFYWFYNVFPELILSKDRSKIVGISTQEASYCRWQIQNPSNGLVEYCYINASWENFKSEGDKYTSVVPVLDPYFDAIGNLRDMGEHKVIYPVSYPTPGKTYYQLAHWNGARSSGWLDVAQSIPKFKKYLFENQITLKYHIQIPSSFWEWKYPDWVSMPLKERKDKIDEELKRFEEVMTGTDGSFKSLFSSYIADQDGKEYGKWIVTELGTKNNSDLYIEDSAEASSHLLYALGVDPTLVGYSIGKGMGAGSGSDKREAFNMYQNLCQLHRDIILEPLNFIRDYNGWDPKLRFLFRYGELKTADKLKPEERGLSKPEPKPNAAV